MDKGRAMLLRRSPELSATPWSRRNATALCDRSPTRCGYRIPNRRRDMNAVPLHRRKSEPATSVVIVGSGFAAFECARGLVRRLDRARASDVRVTIISPVDYMQYTPLLADVAGGLVDP